MSRLRQLRHWLTGRGRRIGVSEFVPETHPLRQWADVIPWPEFVAATQRNSSRRFPKQQSGGQAPVPIRVLLALELLKAETNCSDEEICHRFRTDFGVMYACGIEEVQVDGSQDYFVLPEVLCQFRGRIDDTLMDEFAAIQSAVAIDAGLVSPEHLVMDTFPSEQGSQRVTDATTLYKAKKKSLKSQNRSQTD